MRVVYAIIHKDAKVSERKSILSDLPTLTDRLNWGSEVARMQYRVENCPTPHVIGVHGCWGSGKTSFMRQLQRELGGKCSDLGNVQGGDDRVVNSGKVVTIWFDAWRYQNEPNPIVALIQEMRRQFSTIPSVISKFKKVGEISLRYTLDGLGEIGKAIGFESMPDIGKIQKLGEEWEKSNFAQDITCDSIRDHLHNTIVALLPESPGSRVVVFVDDLDRCSSKSAFKLLEGLKIYFNLPNCVFVLGMNEDVLTEAISSEVFSNLQISSGEKHLRASHYLEKICTDVYRLPLPSNAVSLFSAMLYTATDKDKVDSFNLAVGDGFFLPPNPRRLKALANQWVRFSGCIPFPDVQSEREIWCIKVLIASYIHQFHRDIWERWHFDPNFWVECMAWCSGERSFNIDGVDISPAWATHLKLTSREYVGDSGVRPAWSLEFPNPGSINIFWIDELVRKYRDHLLPLDFVPLLEGRQCGEVV